MVEISLIFYTLLIVGGNVLCEKETSKNVHYHKHPVQKARRPSDLHKQGQNRYKDIKAREGMDRCIIVDCPPLLIVYPNFQNALNALQHKEKTRKKPSTNTSPEKPLSQNGMKLIKKTKTGHRPLQGKRSLPITKVREKENKSGARKYTYRGLTLHQKHLLLKQLNLGNKHGNKAYEFRHFSNTACRVVCLDEYSQSSTPSSQQNNAKDSEGDNSDEDSYHEGEDTPIEATIKPNAQQNNVVGGIRPFGAVDFTGMDDFGPSGEPARDIPKTDDRHY